MTKILVTGVNGFVGHHVANELHNRNIEVLGVSNQPELEDNLVDIVGEYICLDLTNSKEVGKINLGDIDAIINLAGFAQVGSSGGQGELYNKVNVGVHTTLYDECLHQGVSPRIIAVSTGAVYDPNQELPITEESSMIPHDRTNEYVISKQLMEDALGSYSDKGLEIITVRPFNHSGPGQLPGFLLPDLGTQIKSARNEGMPLMVGNLKTKRDYTDVRDVALAYVLLATSPKGKLQHSIYNICSGKSVEGTEILNLLKDAFDASDVTTEIDQSRIRKNDVMDIYGSRDRITQDTGWKPTISIEKMVKDFADWQQSINS